MLISNGTREIEYPIENFKVEFLNRNPFLDYREACKWTEGIKLCESNCCIDETKMKEDCTPNPKFCTKFGCINNFYWSPKDKLKYWKKQMSALHSPIRSIHIRIKDLIPRSVAMQLVRHTLGHPQPFIQSSRPDWTGKERSNDPYELKWCMFDFTPESFLYMMRKRLCNRTEIFTRTIVKQWKENLEKRLKECTDDFDKISMMEEALLLALGQMSVPQCEVNGANKCPELKSCGKYEGVIK